MLSPWGGFKSELRSLGVSSSSASSFNYIVCSSELFVVMVLMLATVLMSVSGTAVGVCWTPPRSIGLFDSSS